MVFDIVILGDWNSRGVRNIQDIWEHNPIAIHFSSKIIPAMRPDEFNQAKFGSLSKLREDLRNRETDL